MLCMLWCLSYSNACILLPCTTTADDFHFQLGMLRSNATCHVTVQMQRKMMRERRAERERRPTNDNATQRRGKERDKGLREETAKKKRKRYTERFDSPLDNC